VGRSRWWQLGLGLRPSFNVKFDIKRKPLCNS
jgi:hypothetical protein